MASSTWEEMGFGPYPVSEISHTILKLSDGIDLAMKVWLPCSKRSIQEHFPLFSINENDKWTEQIYPGKDLFIFNDNEKIPFYS